MVVSLLNQFRRGRVPAGECVVMAVMVMLLLLAGFAESNRMRYSKQKEVESKYLMMDPSANYGKTRVCVDESMKMLGEKSGLSG